MGALEDYIQSSNDYITQNQNAAKGPTGFLGSVDPLWLAAAQGFLSPTKSGSFFESVGNAAGQVQGPLSKMKEQQLSAQDKILAARKAQAELMLRQQQASRDTDMDELRKQLIQSQIAGQKSLIDYRGSQILKAQLQDLQNSYKDSLGRIPPEKMDEYNKKKDELINKFSASSSNPLSDEDLENAKDAIARGANKSQIMDFLKKKGYSTEGLE